MDDRPGEETLKRSVGYLELTLYGVGTTVGAGIYALLGEISATAGYLAPWSFLTSALLAGFTAASFAYLSSHFPQTAGAALYVQKGFDSISLARIVGYLVIAAGVFSSATLLNGFAHYFRELVDLPATLIILATTLGITAIACWGIKESVATAATITIVEVVGLAWIGFLCWQHPEPSLLNTANLMPESSGDFFLITTAALLAFYAYIGFEDMVEMAEEIRNPAHTLPAAIFTTLAITSIVYVFLVLSVLSAMPPETLAQEEAPLAAVYTHITGNNPIVISAIGMFAIINGALIQLIMVARVFYGLGRRNQLPAFLKTMTTKVHPKRQTPVAATVLGAALILAAALIGGLAELATNTSIVMLLVFTLVNASAFRLQIATRESGKAVLSCLGALTCLYMAVYALI